mgnify:FL=1
MLDHIEKKVVYRGNKVGLRFREINLGAVFPDFCEGFLRQVMRLRLAAALVKSKTECIIDMLPVK